MHLLRLQKMEHLLRHRVVNLLRVHLPHRDQALVQDPVIIQIVLLHQAAVNHLKLVKLKLLAKIKQVLV
jgi:hypothetical protein